MGFIGESASELGCCPWAIRGDDSLRFTRIPGLRNALYNVDFWNLIKKIKVQVVLNQKNLA